MGNNNHTKEFNLNERLSVVYTQDNRVSNTIDKILLWITQAENNITNEQYPDRAHIHNLLCMVKELCNTILIQEERFQRLGMTTSPPIHKSTSGKE